MASFIRFTVFFLFLIPFLCAEEPERVPLPQAVGVLGDSISEGMMSEFSIERPPTLSQALTKAGHF